MQHFVKELLDFPKDLGEEYVDLYFDGLTAYFGYQCESDGVVLRVYPAALRKIKLLTRAYHDLKSSYRQDSAYLPEHLSFQAVWYGVSGILSRDYCPEEETGTSLFEEVADKYYVSTEEEFLIIPLYGDPEIVVHEKHSGARVRIPLELIEQKLSEK